MLWSYNTPELKESEDERIRDEIISAIKEDWPGHTDWITWLEKQGKQGEPIGDTDTVDSNEDGLIAATISSKPTGVQPKQEWSEDDEKMLDSIIEEVRYMGDFPDYPTKEENELYDECLAKVEWLKSLKDRVPSKQEWSEEDEQYLLVCKNALRKYQVTDKWDSNIISQWLDDKLKSLRPQQWKPTEEQIRRLEYFLKLWGKTDDTENTKVFETVKSLLNDLKQLKDV